MKSTGRWAPKRPATLQNGTSLIKIVIYLAVGFAMGIFLGYILMGTTHAILETRDNAHFAGHNTTRSTASTKKASDNAVHILTTSNGSPYQNYQMRIAYATWQLTQSMPGGDRFVGFTRILHRTVDDELMDEIPTFRANPLQPECDGWCEYPVSDRANAVQQFFTAAKKDPSMLKATWLYMIESDYVFMKPLELPPPGVSSTQNGQAWGFPFDYIRPQAFPGEMRRLFPEEKGPVSAIPNTGPAPFLMTREDWEKVTPEWERLTAVIEGDGELKRKLGWVREMYAFSAATALLGINVDLARHEETKFISQLPIDSGLGDAHAFHYTQCTIYKTVDKDEDVWKYDKRFYTTEDVALKVPLIEDPPQPWKEGWKFIEGNPVTKEKHEAITLMIRQMNKGIETLEDLN